MDLRKDLDMSIKQAWTHNPDKLVLNLQQLATSGVQLESKELAKRCLEIDRALFNLERNNQDCRISEVVQGARNVSSTE